jgi:hypothetical protein
MRIVLICGTLQAGSDGVAELAPAQATHHDQQS